MLLAAEGSAMLRFLLVLIVVVYGSIGHTMAASPAVKEAVKTLDSIGLDASKLKAYCVVYEEYIASGDSEAKQAAADEKLTNLLNSFGPRFQKALQVHLETDPSSDDGQALDDAFARLDERCES